MTKKQIFLSVIALLCFTTELYAENALFVTQSYRGGGGFWDYYTGNSVSLEESNSPDLIYSRDTRKTQTVELSYSYQGTTLILNNNQKLFDVDVSYYHIGGTNEISRSGKTQLYVLGGLGVTHFSPDSDFSSETSFSLSLGLGAKYDISKNFVLRSDIKFYGTLLSSGSGIFCNGGCIARVSGTLVPQYEAGIGLGYKF